MVACSGAASATAGTDQSGKALSSSRKNNGAEVGLECMFMSSTSLQNGKLLLIGLPEITFTQPHFFEQVEIQR